MPLTLKRSIPTTPRKLVLKRPTNDTADEERVLVFLGERGEQGVTARALIRYLKWDWDRAAKALWRIHARGLVTHTWAPCADWKTHYALQEGCYVLRGKDQPIPWWAVAAHAQDNAPVKQ